MVPVKVTEEYIALLNKAVAREIQVSAQYMLQHAKMDKLLRKIVKENYLLETTTYDEFGKILKDLAIKEMKHLADIMERIYILGGESTTKPDKVKIGETMKEMAQLGIKAEEEALELYREIITAAKDIGDRETWQMFSKIYSEEEEHLLVFQEYVEMEDEPNIPDPAESEWRTIFEGLRKKKAALEVSTGKNKSSVVSDLLKTTFMQEMEHMEHISERIYEIQKEAVADVDPKPVIGSNPEDFIKLDKEAENYAIMLYRKIISEATKIGDIKTKKMFEDIIEQEEDHYWSFDDYE
jgi:bacterioferritin